jgi:hypothetical protein
VAQTPTCQLDDGLDAAYVVGLIDTGTQLFLCPGHAAHFGLTLALQLLDPAEIINAAQAIGAPPAANGETGEAPANKPARKRATKATAKPKADDQPGGAQKPTPANDGGDRSLQPGKPES